MMQSMITSLHVATGAAGGALAGSRARALALGMLLHAAADRVPHRDIPSRRFETLSAAGAALAVAAARGPLSPAFVGAVAASAPDLEHVVRMPRPGGRKLFPSHRFHGWHRAGGVSASAQLLAAGFLLGLVVGGSRRATPGRG
jgi:hypothetical protein